MAHVTGTFTVQLTPFPADDAAAPTPGRMAIAKQFAGPLTATSRGQMLAAMGDVKGSAGYVAIEVVTGVLDGREGTFALQHLGVSDRGVQSLNVRVVPDTGTGALAGLRGEMQIVVEGGAHSYVFDYELPAV